MKISEFILQHKETDIVDFKKSFYKDDKKYDFIKDLASFSNNAINSDKYIIFGIEDKTFKVCEETEIQDISNLQQLISEYIEPTISFEVNDDLFENKRISYITIKRQNNNLPFIIKKDYTFKGRTYLRKGEIYIRKGATNFIASRNDLDTIYFNKNDFSLFYYDDFFTKISKKYYLSYRLIFNNNTLKNMRFDHVACEFLINGSIIILDKCIFTNDKINEKDKLYISKEHCILVRSMNSCNLYLNFEIDENTQKILQSKKIDYTILKLNSNKECVYSMEINKMKNIREK